MIVYCTVRVATLLVMLPDLAVMSVVESEVIDDEPTARPYPSMLATEVLDELHVTAFVRSTVFPVCKRPVAVNCCDCPGKIVGLVGVMEMETRSPSVTVTLVDAL